jgi:hypothetical protein
MNVIIVSMRSWDIIPLIPWLRGISIDPHYVARRAISTLWPRLSSGHHRRFIKPSWSPPALRLFAAMGEAMEFQAHRTAALPGRSDQMSASALDYSSGVGISARHCRAGWTRIRRSPFAADMGVGPGTKARVLGTQKRVGMGWGCRRDGTHWPAHCPAKARRR